MQFQGPHVIGQNKLNIPKYSRVHSFLIPTVQDFNGNNNTQIYNVRFPIRPNTKIWVWFQFSYPTLYFNLTLEHFRVKNGNWPNNNLTIPN